MTAILEPDTLPAPAPAPVPAVAPAARPVAAAPAPAGAPAPAAAPGAAPARQAATAPPVLPPPVLAAPEPREPRARRVLSATGIRLVGAAMLALIIVSDLLMPAADGAEPVRPVWLETLYTIQTVALLAAAAGFLLARRWALRSAVLVAGIGAFNVAMCPAVGHHVVAGWWFGQVALAAALLALPAAALWRTRAG